MKKQTIIINFKNYKNGKEVLKLAKSFEKYNKEIIVGVPAIDIREVSSKTKLKVYAEHVDSLHKGKSTGFTIPEEVKENGADGTFLNHSEHKLKFNVLKETVKRCSEIGLKTAVFVPSIKEAIKAEKLKPDFLIYEPPELVGGKVSVSSAKPQIVKNLSEKMHMAFLVGAGIHNKKDVKTAMELGASGFAISSAVVLAKNPTIKLREIFGR